MSGPQDEIPPPPPPPPSSSQTPTQPTPHTVSTIKLPILKKGEYDIWAMKMEHYLAHTDYPIWEVIQNGNGPVSITTDTSGQIKVLPPRTAEEIVARERERKARTTLLMALPEDHLAKFHKMTDAKEMWDAIKSRFGGNDESKKMQKYILKQQFEGFSVSNTEGLHKGYDRFQSLLSQLEIHGAGVSNEDANQKFLRSLPSACYPQLDHEDLEQIDEYDLEEIELTASGHDLNENEKVLQEDWRRDAWNSGNKDGSRTGQKEDSKALVTVDGEGVDWSHHSEDEDYALMACNSSDSDTEVISCSNKCKESYANLKKLYDAQREQLSDASIEIKAYSQGLKKVEAQLVAHQQGQLWYEQKIKFMKIDLDDKTDVLTYHKKLLAEAQKEKEDLKAKVEKWHNSSKNLGKLLNTQMSANDKFGLGYGDHRYDGILSYENEVLQSVFMNKESDLENQPLNDSESESQSSECDTCESNISTEPSELVSEPVVIESNVESQPKVWSDAPIIEEYESDSDDECVYIPTKQQETPSFANQQVKTPRENVKSQNTHSQKPKVDKKELGHGFAVRACFVCGSLNHLIRDCDFHEKRMARKADLKNVWNNVHRVNKQNQFVPSAVLTRTGIIPVSTARASSTKNFSTARQSFNRQTVLTKTAMKVNTVKPIVNRVRPANVFHKTHSPTRPFKKTTVLRQKISNQKVNTAKDYPHRALKNKGIVDSGCSRHMTGNKAYLDEFQDFNGGPVAFGGSKGYITGKGGLACLIAKATTDESHKWHRRLGHVNFKNLNKIMKGNLVRGLYLQRFFKMTTLMLLVRKESNTRPPVRPKQFSWVFFLRTKDETSAILKDFIRQIENQLNQKVKTIRSDNGIEFKNKDVIEFCGLKGIKREYSSEKSSNLHADFRSKKGSFYEEAEAAQKSLRPLFIQRGSTKPSSTNIFSTVSTPAKASSTNLVNTVSIPVSTASPHEGISLSDPTNPEEDDSEIPPLEDIYQNSTDGIFTTSSFDDEGAVADFTNLETVVNVQREQTQGLSFIVYLLVSPPPHVLNIELRKISEALEDESWVDAMQEELLQFEIQKVWVLVDLPYRKKAIVSFLYGKIDEEVYVSQPPGFLDPKYPKKVYKVVKALYGLHQAPEPETLGVAEFEALMRVDFRMSSIGRALFLSWITSQNQKHDGIFISRVKLCCRNPERSLDLCQLNVKTASYTMNSRAFS
ncbi:ribonuclease H-like domain-containing protein [Tanacetum coccineum]